METFGGKAHRPGGDKEWNAELEIDWKSKETFRGKAHLPGADKKWNVELEIDWESKEVSVHIDEAPGGKADWPGLAVQTDMEQYEIVFRTAGIPQLFSHWWHFVRGSSNNLWGIVLGVPDVEGKWTTCRVLLEKVK